MRKNYVVDASVILSSPYSLLTFDEHHVIIPAGALLKVERAAESRGEAARNAQSALRLLDDLRTKGDLKKSVPLPSGGTLRVVTGCNVDDSEENIKVQLDYIQYDLDVESRSRLVFVSCNPAARIAATLAGYQAEGYKTDQSKSDYPGRIKLSFDCGTCDKLLRGESVIPSPLEKEALTEGQYIDVWDGLVDGHGVFGGGKVHPLRYGLREEHGYFDPGMPFRPYGVTPRNAGQVFAVDALMAPAEEVPLVILKGPAGTAKTFLALACGLEQVVGNSAKEEKRYDRILVARPNIKFDEDIGFLKGTEEDKIGPLIRPIWDNLEQLTRMKADKNGGKNSYAQYLFDSGLIVAQALAYMRGRSISNTWIIIDEAQNMTPLQAFGIISRAGVGSKIVLTGDPDQVDTPNLDRGNNGLSYASEKMRGSPLCRQITFEPQECERSPLASEAIKRLSLKGQG